MSDVVIRVEGLGKQYRLGANAGPSYKTVRESLIDAGKGPLRKLARVAGKGPGDGERGHRPDFWALKDVNFEVTRGEVLGIVGRNGAGKSTLLKILSQITEPTEGEVRMKGRVASLLEVGTGFHPELTGRENVYLNGAILGMGKAEIGWKFDEIVAFAEVEKFIDTPVKHFSSGMYLRLAFSVAAYLEPEILVVDEVLAVGDANFQKKCMGKMGQIADQGRTVLFVSHDMAAITRLCQRTILLEDGHVSADSATPSVVTRYLSNGSGVRAQRLWREGERAPGNATVRLRSVRVTDASGNVRDTVDIRHPVHIEIGYDCKPTNSFPFVVIHLYDDNGVCVFQSGDFSNPEWRRRPRIQAARVHSTVTIPGNFLSEGLMRVLVGIVTHNPTEVLVEEPDAVSFLVVDESTGDGARGEYVGDIPGVVRPLLNWTIECLPENQLPVEINAES